MDAVGWTRLAPKNQEETSPWAVLTESSGKHLKVYVTDLASLWCEEQNASQIVARCEVISSNKCLFISRSVFEHFHRRS